jgi:hypothetical protein
LVKLVAASTPNGQEWQVTQEQRDVALVIERLQQLYDQLPQTTVSAVVNTVHAKFRNVRARSLVPVLVERFSQRELTALAS